MIERFHVTIGTDDDGPFEFIALSYPCPQLDCAQPHRYVMTGDGMDNLRFVKRTVGEMRAEFERVFSLGRESR